jgi:hypothetical protein
MKGEAEILDKIARSSKLFRILNVSPMAIISLDSSFNELIEQMLLHTLIVSSYTELYSAMSDE